MTHSNTNKSATTERSNVLPLLGSTGNKTPQAATPEELCLVLSGQMTVGGADCRSTTEPLGRVSIDSREIVPGEVFWALKGPHFDGNHFVAEAIGRGASGVVTSLSPDELSADSLPSGIWIVHVRDTAVALDRWAEYRRRQFRGRVIGVTGSVGKTTARHMIDAVLATHGTGSTSPKNYNNRIGVPVSMTSMRPDHTYAVLELGASAEGEIGMLARIARPNVGAITRIGDAHLGGYGSRLGIVHTKLELLRTLPTDGIAVLGDDPWLRSLAPSVCPCPILWVGEHRDCTFCVQRTELVDGRLLMQVDGFRFQLPVWGRHHIWSALPAIAIGRLHGISDRVIGSALETFTPPPQRCEVLTLGDTTVINDSYNASPQAVEAALVLLGEFDCLGRRNVILGDMVNLGPESVALHRRAGAHSVIRGHADHLIAIGRFSEHTVAGARAVGLHESQTIAYKTLDEALVHIGQSVRSEDVTLVKGSRVMAMERVVEHLRDYLNGPKFEETSRAA